MLPCAVWFQPAEQLTEDVVLPRQELEVLAGMLALGVTQHALKEPHHTTVLGLAFRR